MSPTCGACSSSAMRDTRDPKRDRALREMARLGWVNCTQSPFRATFYGMDHPACPKYSEASAEVVAARMAWAERVTKKIEAGP